MPEHLPCPTSTHGTLPSDLVAPLSGSAMPFASGSLALRPRRQAPAPLRLRQHQGPLPLRLGLYPTALGTTPYKLETAVKVSSTNMPENLPCPTSTDGTLPSDLVARHSGSAMPSVLGFLALRPHHRVPALLRLRQLQRRAPSQLRLGLLPSVTDITACSLEILVRELLTSTVERSHCRISIPGILPLAPVARPCGLVSVVSTSYCYSHMF